MAVLLSWGLQTQRTWTLRDENTGEENETMRKPHFSGTTPQNWVSGTLDPKAQDSAGSERQAGPIPHVPTQRMEVQAGTQLPRTQPKSPPSAGTSLPATTPGRKGQHVLLSHPTLSCGDMNCPFVQRIQARLSPGRRSVIREGPCSRNFC